MSETISTDTLLKTKSDIEKVINNIKKVIYIKTDKLEYLLAAKIAGGHVMLADSHGVGKTSLARALAGSIKWKKKKASSADRTTSSVEMETFSRIQCTVDLLPQDILGYNRLDPSSGNLQFSKGPIFSHFILCDEINLLTPKTQGSFFQVMEEQSVSIEGATYDLEDPFFIISTMNLKGSHLFPLPAPQLDRFMIQLSMGYPDPEEEVRIILQHGKDDSWSDFGPVVESKELLKWGEYVDMIPIHEDCVRYISSYIRATRTHDKVDTGASPRAGVKLSRMARSLALLRGLSYVNIDLIKEIIPIAIPHRLILKDDKYSPMEVVNELLKAVSVDKVYF